MGLGSRKAGTKSQPRLAAVRDGGSAGQMAKGETVDEGLGRDGRICIACVASLGWSSNFEVGVDTWPDFYVSRNATTLSSGAVHHHGPRVPRQATSSHLRLFGSSSRPAGLLSNLRLRGVLNRNYNILRLCHLGCHSVDK
jgi:hypothetical protein